MGLLGCGTTCPMEHWSSKNPIYRTGYGSTWFGFKIFNSFLWTLRILTSQPQFCTPIELEIFRCKGRVQNERRSQSWSTSGNTASASVVNIARGKNCDTVSNTFFGGNKFTGSIPGVKPKFDLKLKIQLRLQNGITVTGSPRRSVLWECQRSHQHGRRKNSGRPALGLPRMKWEPFFKSYCETVNITCRGPHPAKSLRSKSCISCLRHSTWNVMDQNYQNPT